ncbi:branched-chain amino acid ABC transporter permease [Hoeflea ulvae]|uniref:Branched-chain amino acid ABC transporter permease n=1 Tax=Hoeflea ulvae TaxID=2983764 RepID=A0ABT3YFN6_9HYPH|nr:branched-chain amino acid ABC transporter permease [Hoeflea ulvae]MCY0094704.1 branched-chain amino acid ABC transporter permease [Hoeflea ulvae]
MRFNLILAAVAAFVVLAAGSVILPDWAMFLFAMALAKGLVCLGIVGMMRGGVVSFGQGLFYCIGAYTATLAANNFGISDIFLLTLLSASVCLLVGMAFGPLLSSYRGIFFAMLSLALSMVLYGSLSKMSAIGGTDGLNIAAPTFLGWAPEGRALQTALYIYVVAVVVIAGTLMRFYFDSERGLITLATRDNELRVEYLGASVRNVMTYNYVFGAVLGGIGGTIAALALGHVDPEFAFWTTSGEFVFVAILAGFLSVPAVFVAAIILELVRSFSSLYFPNTWQLALGIFLLVVIVVLPNGLGSLVNRRKGKAA